MKIVDKKIRAQMISEYMIVIAIIVSATTAMILFVQRTLQAKLKDTKDTVMEWVRDEAQAGGSTANILASYEPYYLRTETEIERSIHETTTLRESGEGPAGMYRKNLDNETIVHKEAPVAPARDAD